MSCCQQATRDYVYIRALELELADAAGTPLTSGARTTAVELRATLQFRLDVVAQGPTGAPFLGSAYARSCPSEGSKGLKAAVAEVVLTSTGLFNGVVAGQSLNGFVRCSLGNSIGRSGADFPLSQLADSLNSNKDQGLRLNRPVFLRISPKPTDNARQQFQLRVRGGNAPDLTQTTPEIIWN